MKVDGYLGSVEFDGAMVTVQKKMRGKVKIPLSSIQGVSIVSAGVGMRGIRFMTAGGSLQQVGKAIGSHSHMHKTKVSRAVALMERRKLVARKANRDDLRESILSLTPAGQAIYDDLAPVALDFAKQLLNAVEPADRPALDRALRKITERSAELANRRGHR